MENDKNLKVSFFCLEPQKRCVSRRVRSETESDGLRMLNDLSRSGKTKSEETDPKVWRVLLMAAGNCAMQSLLQTQI